MEKINNILKYFNLKFKNYITISKGYASKKWLLTDEEDKKYILKEILKQPNERLNYFLSVQSKLNEYSPKIIKTIEGNLFINYDNKNYYLCEYIDNESFELKDDLYNLGIFLANIHNEMFKIKDINGVFLKLENNIEILKEYLGFHVTNNNSEYIDIIEYKLFILKDLKIEDINLNNLTKQVVHGDFYSDNILFDGFNYKIIDFDQCCNFYKEYEILRAMFMSCENEQIQAKDKFNLLKQFIRGYYKINKIKSALDAYNFYLYVQANSLSSIKPDDYGKEAKMMFAQKRYNILKFLVENKKEILEILKGEVI